MARRRTDPAPVGAGDTIGTLVRNLRKQREMTLERLSELTGISVSSLSRIENTRLGMTVAKVEALARALAVPPEMLISGNRTPDPRRPATRRGAAPATSPRFAVDRVRDRSASRDRELRAEYLFGREASRSLDCLHLTIEAISIWDSEFVRHPGEKIIYVIAGALAVYCEKQPPVILETGDSLYMDANVWHSIAAVNGAAAELLVTYYQDRDDAGSFETDFFTPESWAALQDR